ICPGRHMAQTSVWIDAVFILATFDITKAVREDGQVIEPSYEYFSALVSMLLPFKCSIKPRSQRAVELIRATALTRSTGTHEYASPYRWAWHFIIV
ncbi:hypothetical protein B0H19DRAFT_929348, partial [Mycena capillaripes]